MKSTSKPKSMPKSIPKHKPTQHAPTVDFANIHAVPSLHGQWRFAQLVRQAFRQVKPKAIAVELPATLEETIRQGVSRLPYLSVVAYQDYNADIEEVRQILPITPDDSLIEAVRLGMEHNIPVYFIDRDVMGHQAQAMRMPDDLLIERVGLERYWQLVVTHTAHLKPDPPEQGAIDKEREQEMAARLREVAQRHERVLFVCGLAHLQPIIKHFEGKKTAPPGGVTRREQTLYNLSAESSAQVLGGMAYQALAHEFSRHGLHVEDYPQLLPPPQTKGPELNAAREAFRETLELLLPTLQTPDQPAADSREKSSPGKAAGKPVRGKARDIDALALNTFGLLTDLVRNTVRLYDREWNEQPSPQRLNTLLRYARNQALVKHRLAPNRFEMILSAKNTVNDDYAFQMFRLADHYPFYDEESELPDIRIEGQQGEAEGEILELRLRLPRSMQDEGVDLADLDLDEPPEEDDPGAWEERWEDGIHHVSHIPQDLKLEDFFDYLRNKCRRVLADQEVRSHEMQASLMDGLDLRETLRNLPRGKLYVKEYLPALGDVGPVVAIFHRPGEEDHYPHQMMWYAEHDEESDLALYSTDPGQQLDGPGISRCQYGGLLSLYPPTGRTYVWGNPRYEGPHSHAETLLKAAIDLSKKPIVAYVAPQGPSAEMQALAASRGIRIMFIPLDSLSADVLKRVRTFHILADRYIRPLAHVYIRD